jgi:hypothetical protein
MDGSAHGMAVSGGQRGADLFLYAKPIAAIMGLAADGGGRDAVGFGHDQRRIPGAGVGCGGQGVGGIGGRHLARLVLVDSLADVRLISADGGSRADDRQIAWVSLRSVGAVFDFSTLMLSPP